jgi:hypothetical protein
MTEDPLKSAEYSQEDGFSEISKKDFDKVIFEDKVRIAIPQLIVARNGSDWLILKKYGKFKEGDVVFMDEPLCNEEQNIIEIRPNTECGSTLGHVLDLIYRGIWGSQRIKKDQFPN